MATDERLVFSGMRWSAAYLAGVRRVSAVNELPSPDPVGMARGMQPQGVLRWASRETNTFHSPTSVFLLAVTSASSGRPWSASEPAGFWRSFGELDLVSGGDGAEVLRFVQRHGDPFDELVRRLRIDTSNWASPIFGLRLIAEAWDKPDADGVSHITAKGERRSQADAVLAKFLLPDAAHECDVVPDPRHLGLAIRARTLHAYMLASAASAFRRGTPMRRCTNCCDWFEVRRRDMVFCSASCRGAFSAKEK